MSFIIVWVNLTSTCWSISTMTLHHVGKLLLHELHLVLQLPSYFPCHSCFFLLFMHELHLVLQLPSYFPCRSCFFLCFVEFVLKSLFSGHLSRVISGSSNEWRLSKGRHSLAVVSSQVYCAINSTSTLSFSNLLPSLKLDCWI